MDTTDGHCAEDVKMEKEMDNDFSARPSDATHQHVSNSEGPSSSCRRVRGRLRSKPRLQTTKSFPPYSHCIGGLGEDSDWDNEVDSESNIAHQPNLRNEEIQGTERKEDTKLVARCARDELKAKWTMRRKERLGGSFEIDTDGWERGRWIGKRRVEASGREKESDDEEGEEKHWKGRNSNAETERNEDEDKERRSSVVSDIKEKCEGSVETPGGQSKDAFEPLQLREGSTSRHWPSPHPILSKLLHSSTSNSSCSSINLSSESDDVFTEGEDADSKRKAFRKVR